MQQLVSIIPPGAKGFMGLQGWARGGPLAPTEEQQVREEEDYKAVCPPAVSHRRVRTRKQIWCVLVPVWTFDLHFL